MLKSNLILRKQNLLEKSLEGFGIRIVDFLKQVFLNCRHPILDALITCLSNILYGEIYGKMGDSLTEQEKRVTETLNFTCCSLNHKCL